MPLRIPPSSSWKLDGIEDVEAIEESVPPCIVTSGGRCATAAVPFIYVPKEYIVRLAHLNASSRKVFALPERFPTVSFPLTKWLPRIMDVRENGGEIYVSSSGAKGRYVVRSLIGGYRAVDWLFGGNVRKVGRRAETNDVWIGTL
jgi:hypothetical protein